MTTTAGAPHPFTYAESEAIVAALLEEGYTARSYKRRPAGYEVRVSGTRGKVRFHYTITTYYDYIELDQKVPQGFTGADKPYTEGETQ